VYLYFGLDNVGSRRVVWNADGSLKVKFNYSAWGECSRVGGVAADEWLACFTGKEYDATGLVYFNARYYDPTMGRFLTEDPSRKGTSWYSYCSNNPLTYTDPTGRREIVDEDRSGRPVYGDPKEAREAQNKWLGERDVYHLRGYVNKPNWRDYLMSLPQKLALRAGFFDPRYGFGLGTAATTQTCQTIGLLGIYAATTEGGIPLSKLDSIISKAKKNGSLDSVGGIADFDKFSKTIASELGREKMFAYAGPMGAYAELSEGEFMKSDYGAAIVEQYNRTTRYTHFTGMVRTDSIRESFDSLPLDRPQAAGYSIKNVRPLQEVLF
jgi:RHS repeat-associated protein